jgi:hypothetical protein
MITFRKLKKEISKLISSGNYFEANELLLKIPSADRRRSIRDFYNDKLKSSELEWSSHGIARTFRFWSIDEKRAYLDFANSLISALSVNWDVCFGYGAVLAMLRSSDLIPHDNDLDLIVVPKLNPDYNYIKQMKMLEDELTSSNFNIRGDYLSHRHVDLNDFCVDIFLGACEFDFVSWHPGSRRAIRYDEVFPAKVHTFLGADFLIPKQSETYLRKVYGENWSTPNPDFSHSFDPTPYGDWFWPE